MKAARISSPQSVRIEDIAPPEPARGQVRIRVEGCGLCGSNLPPYLGRPWFSYPMPPGAPGHEPWGIIDAIGPDTNTFVRGQRVAFLADRAFAELAVANVDDVVALPEALASRPVPGEPIACAVNVAKRAAFSAGDRVAVIGVGFLGAMIVALARAAGAEVEAWSRRTFALDVARRAGASAAHTLDSDPGSAAGTFGCVVEAAGEQQTLDFASALVAERGRLVVAGYHQDGARSVNMQSWNWRGIDVINAHERDPRRYVDGMREGIDLIARGAIDPEPFYTHQVPLDRIGDAFSLAASRPDGFLKALVTT
jgi:threonine dehydrogenase-like Zn-dependent dehydrogenase